MKRILFVLALVFAMAATPAKVAEAAPLMRNVVTSCAFGAGMLAATTYAGLTPALSAPGLTLPVTEVIAANALIGCGIGAAGAVTATVVGWVYDVIF